MKMMGSTRDDVYNRLNDALAERGCVNDYLISSPMLNGTQREMLGDLEQRLDSLHQGSKDMVAQVNARFLAVGSIRGANIRLGQETCN